MKNLKYELIEAEENPSGLKYRVKALRNFKDVREGDVGGLVSNEKSVSQEGNCWVFPDAKMLDDSKIFNNATLRHRSMMYGKTEMHDDSTMRGDAEMRGTSELHGYSAIRGTHKLVDKILRYHRLYKYTSSPVLDGSEKVTRIRMGCDTRTIEEWRKNFRNNTKEFPISSEEEADRLNALNYILMTLGEEIIQVEDNVGK